MSGRERDVPSFRWLAGDLQSQCGIGDRIGGLGDALGAAADHLDFCSVTGHANGPDLPTDRSRYGALVDYHLAGFERLAGQWDQVAEEVEAASLESRSRRRLATSRSATRRTS